MTRTYNSTTAALSTRFAALNQRLQAGIAPTLLEPDLLTGTNVISLFPPVVFQWLEPLAVGAEPQGNALPLAVTGETPVPTSGRSLAPSPSLALKVIIHSTIFSSSALAVDQLKISS